MMQDLMMKTPNINISPRFGNLVYNNAEVFKERISPEFFKEFDRYVQKFNRNDQIQALDRLSYDVVIHYNEMSPEPELAFNLKQKDQSNVLGTDTAPLAGLLGEPLSRLRTPVRGILLSSALALLDKMQSLELADQFVEIAEKLKDYDTTVLQALYLQATRKKDEP